METALPFILLSAGIAAGALVVWLVMRKQWEQARALYDQGAADTAALRDKVTALTADLAAAEADKRHLQQLLDKQLGEAQAEQQKHKQEIDEMQKRLTTEFENIANRVLHQRQEDLAQQSRKQIGDMLLPLSERLKDFREQVNNAFSQETREKASLQAELKQLIELNRTLEGRHQPNAGTER